MKQPDYIIIYKGAIYTPIIESKEKIIPNSLEEWLKEETFEIK